MMTTAISVTLLFNQNLSYQLPRLLADLYPESLHVLEIDLAVGGDNPIWDYAKERGFVIVTKDTDYRELSSRLGHPPKVALIRLGNCPVAAVESLLRERYGDILALERDDSRGLLELP